MASELKSSASSSSDEKARIERVDNVDADVEGSVDPRIQPEVYNAHIDTSGVDEKKLMRKLDWWLVPWLSFLYLLSFLDRTSIGNAKVRALYSDQGIPAADWVHYIIAVWHGERPWYQRHTVQHRVDNILLLVLHIRGALQRLPEASPTVNMALAPHAVVGCHDGMPSPLLSPLFPVDLHSLSDRARFGTQLWWPPRCVISVTRNIPPVISSSPLFFFMFSRPK